eukprot:4523718-Pyramimonas_sp.AAC.1
MGPGDYEGWKEVGRAPACAKCGCKNNVRWSLSCKTCGHKLSDLSPAAAPEPRGVWGDAGQPQQPDYVGMGGKKGKGRKGKGKGQDDASGGGPALPRAPGA